MAGYYWRFCFPYARSCFVGLAPRLDSDSITLSNDAISATWSIHGGSLRWQTLTNHFTRATLPLDGSVFEFVPKEGAVLRSSDCKIVAAPVFRDVQPALTSSRAADRLPGRELRIVLEDPSAKIRIIWKAILREGANYIRQEVTIRALHETFGARADQSDRRGRARGHRLWPRERIARHRRHLVYGLRASSLGVPRPRRSCHLLALPRTSAAGRSQA